MIAAMPRIVIDCRFAAGHSGLGRYTRELVRELVRRPGQGVEYALALKPGDGEWIPEDADGVRVLRIDAPHYSLAEQTRLPALLKDAKADLLFSPHFNVPLRCPVPFVATVHDLILHAYPNQAGLAKQAAYRLLMRHAVRFSAAVITVSAFVAGELERVYGARLSRKLAVVTEGVNPSFAPRPAAEIAQLRLRLGLKKPFFLYVGNAKQHKNVQCLLDAWRLLGDASKELVLVTGGPEARALALPAGARLVTGIDDADLPALYGAAEALVTASLHEGFCLPVAEAAACGCPVIASNRTAIPEVAPAGSILLEPAPEAFAAAMRGPLPVRMPAPPRPWSASAARTEEILLGALR